MAQIHDGLQGDLGNLKDDIKQVHQDLSGLVHSVSDKGAREWKQAQKVIEKKAGQGMASVSSAMEDVAEQSEDAFKSLQEGIGKRPITSIAAALGLGYLLGKLFSRE